MAVKRDRDQYKHRIVVLSKTDGTLTDPGAFAKWLIGGYRSDAVSGIVSMSSEGGNAEYTTFEKYPTGAGAMGGTDYVVPTGKTLYITKVIFCVWTASKSIVIGYGDTAVSFSASAPTNAVGLISRAVLVGVASMTMYTADLVLNGIPAGKYPYAFGYGGSYTIAALGVEV